MLDVGCKKKGITGALFSYLEFIEMFWISRLSLVFALCIPVMPLAASDYGSNGLIDIPSARMSADGTLTTTAAIQSSTSAYSLTYQATPWLEGTFRYTGFNDFFFMIVITRSNSSSGPKRSIDRRLLLAFATW
jgi:hypothetical protein|tara:strand:- start:507 stop:905 length:399 start_codon:yes stop_codon:yes gene_type:complete